MSNTTSPMVATKTCKQCQTDLPLTAFGTKQARCKQCIRDLRSGKVKLHNPTTQAQPTAKDEAIERILAQVDSDITMEASMDDEINVLDTTPEAPATTNESLATERKKVSDMTKDELEAYTLDRANRLQKPCTIAGHGTITGPNLSRAYARRGNIQCRQCVNESDRERKAARKAQA